MTDIAWIDLALSSARPQAVSALLRYFRDIDLAEEAFQEACLKALQNWPRNGPPRSPAAWLIMVGRNAAIDAKRRGAKNAPLPDDASLSDLGDAETRAAEAMDDADYRDDILRLLFICCHPALPATQQIALALRIVSGLTVRQIAKAFLVGEAAMEQRITRAKRLIAQGTVPFDPPGPVERAERSGVVLAMIYLVFNEGYSASGADQQARRPLCDEAVRLSRLLLQMFPSEPEIMGLTALLLMQHARSPARLDSDGRIILLENQNRQLWNQVMINEGLVLVDKAARHRRPGPYQLQAAIAAMHSRAHSFGETNWSAINAFYRILEELQPSPVVTLNRAAALSKLEGPQAALDLIEPLGPALPGYFYYHGLRGHLLKELGLRDEAREAFGRAISLANSVAEADHIRKELDSLSRQSAAACVPE